MLQLGASYSEQVSSSEVVQVSTEGVEQLETYFGKYLPQDYHEGADYAAQFHKRDGHCSIWWLNNLGSVSLLSGLWKPQIRF